MCGAHKNGTLVTYLEITGEYLEMLGLISWKSLMHADSLALNSTVSQVCKFEIYVLNRRKFVTVCVLVGCKLLINVGFDDRWVAMLAFGEGWHNNHHAFEYSARHGLEWWELDPTWWVIRSLEAVGLATKVKLPRKEHMDKLAFNSA